jgi:peptidoglycan/xylan/chitin deacetylase (PgdA/CDA1 family)
MQVGTLEKRDVRRIVRTRLHNHEILIHTWEYRTMTRMTLVMTSFNSRPGTLVII